MCVCVCVLCREIVKGSHLKPLEKKDTTGHGVFRQPWNTASSGRADVGERGEGEDMSLGRGDIELSQQSFVREWRRLATQPQTQYRYI